MHTAAMEQSFFIMAGLVVVSLGPGVEWESASQVVRERVVTGEHAITEVGTVVTAVSACANRGTASFVGLGRRLKYKEQSKLVYYQDEQGIMKDDSSGKMYRSFDYAEVCDLVCGGA